MFAPPSSSGGSMATLKESSPATRTSTEFGLWGTVVASVAKSVLQPKELQDLAIVAYAVVSALGTVNVNAVASTTGTLCTVMDGTFRM